MEATIDHRNQQTDDTTSQSTEGEHRREYVMTSARWCVLLPILLRVRRDHLIHSQRQGPLSGTVSDSPACRAMSWFQACKDAARPSQKLPVQRILCCPSLPRQSSVAPRARESYNFLDACDSPHVSKVMGECGAADGIHCNPLSHGSATLTEPCTP